MITAKSIFKNLPKAAPEIEAIANPGPADTVCPICENELGTSKVCYRVGDPAVLAHYSCETAWVRAETAILLACRSAARTRTDLAIAVRNARLFGRVLDSLVAAGRIERVEGRIDERFILDTRADAERVVELLTAAGPMNEDSIMFACGLAGSRCNHILHELVDAGRLSCQRQGLMQWYSVRDVREEAA